MNDGSRKSEKVKMASDGGKVVEFTFRGKKLGIAESVLAFYGSFSARLVLRRAGRQKLHHHISKILAALGEEGFRGFRERGNRVVCL